MEMESSTTASAKHNNNDQKNGIFRFCLSWLKLLLQKSLSKVSKISQDTKELGKDDPRRVIHSVKVGVALSIVSIFYYYQPLYDNFGVSAMWAVMTVVVVFEYTVGATLGKGLNRGLATLAAGALGVGAHHLASLSGQVGEPILLGIFVFLQATLSTFIRFFPKIKARYDYGLLIFILTFSLISVSGFRDDEILEMAHKRLSTIFIGSSACVIICILVCPVWAGEDLHNLIALNLEKLGNFLEGFGDEYFNTTTSVKEEESKDDKKTFLQGYKSVLNSKSSEESLANFARWEPGHGRFKFRHPWQQYLKVATLIRQCAYRIEALHGHLNTDPQASPEIREQIQEACTKISLESGKALKEVANSVRKMTKTSSDDIGHIASSKAAAKSLRSLFKSGMLENIDLLEVIPSVTVASLLIDVVNCTEKIAESVHELGSLAHFRTSTSTIKSDSALDPNNVSPEKSKSKIDYSCPTQPQSHHVVITINTQSAPAPAPTLVPDESGNARASIQMGV
ncbi:aluminum-activated malate transporter 2 [Humulus lupulus]|uniref:aluminum-activated malate transporter 2 n=1 Tax=Humulus lupulus TaxID=3486 RepID=UPI002B40EEC8|nr:aluminum-activated malate transporter 2 [Humulus lupulus]